MLRKDSYKENVKDIKIFIVDDHAIVRQGLKEFINHQQHFTVCGQAENADEALKAIRTHKPDVAIVDISLLGRSGMDLIKDIKILYPDLIVLIFSMYDEPFYVEKALKTGANGYVTKQEPIENIISALNTVLSDEIYLSESMSKKMISNMIKNDSKKGFSDISALSVREIEVLRLLGEGHTSSQVANMLHLSSRTIDTHRCHIKKKLNLKNAAELWKYAVKWVESTSENL